MPRAAIAHLLAGLALACGCTPHAGPAPDTALERLPPHPLGEEIFDAGYVTFRDGGRQWDMDLWSCHVAGSSVEEVSTCVGLGITDGEEVFWLEITSREPLLGLGVQTVPHAASTVAVLVTADLATDDQQGTRNRTWLLADSGEGPRLVESP